MVQGVDASPLYELMRVAISSAIAQPCSAARAVMIESQRFWIAADVGGGFVVVCGFGHAAVDGGGDSHVQPEPSEQRDERRAGEGGRGGVTGEPGADRRGRGGNGAAAPGKGRRWSPYWWIRPAACVSSRSVSAAMAGRNTSAENDVGAVDHAYGEDGEGGECGLAASIGQPSRERGDRTHLLEQLERVEFVPVLGEQAVANAPDVDRVHFDLSAAGRYAEERSGVPATIRVAANDGAPASMMSSTSTRKSSKAARKALKTATDPAFPGSAYRLWLT